MSSKSKKPKQKPELVKDTPQKAPTQSRLAITQEQLKLLAQADQGVAAANERFNLVFTAIVNGHGIEDAKLADAGVDDEGPYLTIQRA